MKTYVIAGGCFWCLDAVYRRLKGVTKVVSGYAGGQTDDPTYYEVSSGETGHAEVVEITFDESIIPADVILDLFFLIHDPTTLNRQGADVGTQYRSAMYYTDAAQQSAFQSAAERATTHWDNPIVTTIEPLETFYPAEEEHQDYFNNNPGNGYCSIVIAPKIVKARSHYTEWFKEA
ncbi:peptide-methionine (S)-S-oxide reductase MsrA [Candidatus Saccharibacteria bacterium]|nr:peptide-methionine (S)-S-oxide reductase MsrA [Candidatus Saccharibacteria bacterium]